MCGYTVTSAPTAGQAHRRVATGKLHEVWVSQTADCDVPRQAWWPSFLVSELV